MIQVFHLAILNVLVTAAPAPAVAQKVEFPLSCNAQAKTLFQQGRDAASNAQAEVARDAYQKALAADPKCVLAKLYLGRATPGNEGKVMVDEALAAPVGLGEAEKLELASVDAARKGDQVGALNALMKERDLLPGFPLLHIQVAGAALAVERYDDMLAAAKKATELNPKAGAGWNMLGYALVYTHKYDEAVAAFRHYVEAASNEPNAHDSLADALMYGGHFDEAVSEYQRALDLSGGKFWNSWTGLATLKFVRGDVEGARDALSKGHDAASNAADKAQVAYWVAVSYVAQGNTAEALKAADAAEKEATAAKLDFYVAEAPLVRGEILISAGRFAEAAAQFMSVEKVKVDALNPGSRTFIDAAHLEGLVEANVRLGKMPDAEKALSRLEAAYKSQPNDLDGKNFITRARGLVALAKNDVKGAVTALSKCTDDYDLCKVTLSEAQERAGDSAAAADARTAVLRANRRDLNYWIARPRAEAAPGKKVAQEKEAPKK